GSYATCRSSTTTTGGIEASSLSDLVEAAEQRAVLVDLREPRHRASHVARDALRPRPPAHLPGQLEPPGGPDAGVGAVRAIQRPERALHVARDLRSVVRRDVELQRDGRLAERSDLVRERVRGARERLLDCALQPGDVASLQEVEQA